MISFSTKEATLKLIKIEKNSLTATLYIQKNFNKQILTFLKTFMGNVELELDYDSENSIFVLLNNANLNLKKTNENIRKLNSLIQILDNISASIPDKTDSLIEEDLEEYNKKFSTIINATYKNTSSIEKFIYEISSQDISKLYNQSIKNAHKLVKKELKTEKDKFLVSSNDLDSSFIENTLIISEIKKHVILPYTIEDLKNILIDPSNNFSTMEEIIDKKYTIPINKFSPSCFARFRETMKLITKKEHLSKLKGLSLANELFFNYSLHPAIITACKSLDELDIYLACLDDNCLEDFNYFDIKFEAFPAVVSEPKIKGLL